MTLKISILIPCYNNEKVIRDAIESALAQNYPYKEIVVVDDCSKDNTVKIASEYPGVRVVVNPQNLGIGKNLANCFTHAQGRYVLFLCGDDIFADWNVARDVVKIFNEHPSIGAIDRHYYQFLNGYEGAVTRVEETNILMSAICPSGMAFRKQEVTGENRVFIEMPGIVAQYLKKWCWTRMDYDTVAVRIHPGGNTGTLSTYYTESPTLVLTEFYGPDFKYYPLLVQLKNRAPKMVWDEICTMIALKRSCLREPLFWLCALTAIVIPMWVLQHLSSFYRHRINRRKAFIVRRKG